VHFAALRQLKSKEKEVQMSYNPFKHGRAEYGGYMQVPDAQVITEGTDAIPLSAQKFAQLTYQVNPTTVALSGVTIAASIGIDGTGTVHATAGNELMTSDATSHTALTELLVDNTYSKIVTTVSGYTYTMFAPAGTSSGAPSWRISRTDAAGSRMWADGDADFDNAASGFAALTYSF